MKLGLTLHEDNWKIILMFFLPTVVYLRDLVSLINEALTNDLAQHILIIPFLIAYILYRKRNVLRTTMNLPKASRRILDFEEVSGMLLCLAAFLLYFHAFYTPYSLEYHVLSLILFVSGLALLLFNYRTLRELALPIILLAFLTPPPIEVVAELGVAMANFSSTAAVTLANLLGISASLTEIYGASAILVNGLQGPCTFMMGIPCSGIYSLIGYLSAAVFLAYLMKGPIWKKGLMFVLSIPFIYSLNILRVALIIAIGYFYGESLAVEAFHLFGGWVLITIGIFTILLLSEKLGKMQIVFSSKPFPDCSYCNQGRGRGENYCINCGKILNLPRFISPPGKTVAKLLFLNLILILFVIAQTPSLMITEGPIQMNITSATGVQNAYGILPQISGWDAVFVKRDTAFEQLARQDAALVYGYIPAGANQPLVWVAMEIASSTGSLHRWEVCLTWPGSKYELLRLSDVPLSQSPAITGRLVEYRDQRTNVQGVVLYWFERLPFLTDTGWQFKHVKTSLVAFPAEWSASGLDGSIPAVEETLISFGEAIINSWEPLKYLSFFSILSYWGNLLTTAIFAVIISMVSFQLVKTQNEKRINLKLYNRIVLPNEKLLIQSVYQAAKNNKSVGSEIAAAYSQLAKDTISLEELDATLTDAEETGIITQDVINENDQPRVLWKPRIAFHENFLERKLKAVTNFIAAPFSKIIRF